MVIFASIILPMPDFKTEKELQQHLVKRLKERGYDVQSEVPISNRKDRIDILTEKEIIECKKILTRSTGYHASGQLHYYQRYFPERSLAIAVEVIKDKNAAERLKDQGIKIYHVSRPKNGKQSELQQPNSLPFFTAEPAGKISYQGPSASPTIPDSPTPNNASDNRIYRNNGTLLENTRFSSEQNKTVGAEKSELQQPDPSSFFTIESAEKISYQASSAKPTISNSPTPNNVSSNRYYNVYYRNNGTPSENILFSNKQNKAVDAVLVFTFLFLGLVGALSGILTLKQPQPVSSPAQVDQSQSF